MGDYEMTFSVLCDGSSGQSKRICSDHSITPRLMMDVSPNTGFGIVYELGDFWNANSDMVSACSDNLNTTWWSNADVSAAAAGPSENNQFVNDHVLHSVSKTSIGTMVIMVIAVAAMALLRIYGVATRKKAVDAPASKEAVAYG